jgi:hypothetical protein
VCVYVYINKCVCVCVCARVCVCLGQPDVPGSCVLGPVLAKPDVWIAGAHWLL